MFIAMIQQAMPIPAPAIGSDHIANWAVVFATIFGPILAVIITRRIDRLRANEERKVWIFRTLMATRDMNLSVSMEHVQALQMIEVEFSKSRRKERAVVDAWRLYQQHLNTPAPDEDKANYWGKRQFELLCKLVHRIAEYLGYNLNEAQIREVYSPRVLSLRRIQEDAIWHGIAKLVSGGETHLKIQLVATGDDLPAKEAFAQLIKGETPLSVRLVQLDTNPKNSPVQTPVPLGPGRSEDDLLQGQLEG